MTTEWWLGAPSATATVDCGPNRHRLVWERGRLKAIDHADPETERILIALGGSEPPCLARIRHWADHASDPRVLTLAGRHPGDTLGLTPDDVVAVRSLLDQDEARLAARGGALSSAAAQERIEANRRHLDLLDLLALDPALVRRLQAEVAHNLSAVDPLPATNCDVLEAATVGRLVPLVERWSATDRPGEPHHPDQPVSVALGHPPAVSTIGGVTAVTVGPDWLAEVWGRYLGVVEGFLVLEVLRIVDGRAEVRALGAPGGADAHLTLAGPAPWHVVRRDDLAP